MAQDLHQKQFGTFSSIRLIEDIEALKLCTIESMARILAWNEFKADVITSLLNEYSLIMSNATLRTEKK